MNKVKALIVEDCKIWQHNIRRWLERYDCYVDIAGSYDEARRALDRNVYNMVILDIVINPDVEGPCVSAYSDWESLMHQLTQAFPSTPVFVISALLGDEPERIRQLNPECGVTDFMAKSNFSHEILEQWVDQVRRFKQVGNKPMDTCQNLFSSP